MCGLIDQQSETTESHVTIIDKVHEACNNIISAQMTAIQQLKNQVQQLHEQNKHMEMEMNDLKTKTIRNLTLRVRRQEDVIKQKEADVVCLQQELKDLKREWCLPPPATDSDQMLMELIMRRNAFKSQPYTDKLKVFAFNCMYISPKGYRYIHSNFPTILPHPRSNSYWMKDVHASPGILQHIQINLVFNT